MGNEVCCQQATQESGVLPSRQPPSKIASTQRPTSGVMGQDLKRAAEKQTGFIPIKQQSLKIPEFIAKQHQNMRQLPFPPSPDFLKKSAPAQASKLIYSLCNNKLLFIDKYFQREVFLDCSFKRLNQTIQNSVINKSNSGSHVKLTKQIDVNLPFYNIVTVIRGLARVGRAFLDTVLLTQQNLVGIHLLRLFPNLKEHFVLIDDYYPFHKSNQTLFINLQGPDVCPLLLLKAYAKLYGSFTALSSRTTDSILSQLTGAPARLLKINSQDPKSNFLINGRAVQAINDGNVVIVVAKSKAELSKVKSNFISNLYPRQSFILKTPLSLKINQTPSTIFPLQSPCQEELLGVVDRQRQSQFFIKAFEMTYEQLKHTSFLTQNQIVACFDIVLLGLLNFTQKPIIFDIKSNGYDYFRVTLKTLSRLSVRLHQSQKRFSGAEIHIIDLKKNRLLFSQEKDQPFWTEFDGVLDQRHRFQAGDYLVQIRAASRGEIIPVMMVFQSDCQIQVTKSDKDSYLKELVIVAASTNSQRLQDQIVKADKTLYRLIWLNGMGLFIARTDSHKPILMQTNFQGCMNLQVQGQTGQSQSNIFQQLQVQKEWKLLVLQRRDLEQIASLKSYKVKIN